MTAFIAFDLDGVLYSAEPFLAEAYREAIAAVERQRPGSFTRLPSTREILDHVGWPVTVILERLFPTAAAEAIDLLNAETLAIICQHVRRGNGTLFPAVAETLAKLAADGFLLGVASNGRRAYVEAVVDTYRLRSYFCELIAIGPGLDDKTAVLRAYLARLGVKPVHSVMVGDRSSDVEAARAVGAHFIGCDYGHGYRAEIAEAGPIIAKLDELPVVANKVLNPKLVALPAEPNVFECRLCHKVFEARRLRPACPECDSDDVELVSD